MATGEIGQITNVLGGAFFPTVNAAGDIIYSSYTSGGYKIVRMEKPAVMAEGNYHYIMTGHGGGTAAGNWQRGRQAGRPEVLRLRNSTGTRCAPMTTRNVPEASAKPYKSIFSSLMFVPFLRVDNYNPRSTGLDVIKPGVYVFSDEVLGKTGFFAGIALNRLLERDLFLQFFYRGRIPILYQLGFRPIASLELYNVTQEVDRCDHASRPGSFRRGRDL